MKARKEHRVPLAPRALKLLRELPREAGNPSIFIGPKAGTPLSKEPMTYALRCVRSGVTAHGFRSTFRTWAAEQTNAPREIAEQALAHAIGDRTERAYARTTLFDKRRRLMDQWARFATTPRPSADKTVVPIRARR